MTIWKFPLLVEDFQVIKMPEGAQVLTVQVQDNQPYLWAAVDENAKLKPRRFIVKGTGHPFPEYGLRAEYNIPTPYIGTFQLEGGSLVFHVFEAVLQ